MSIQAYDSVFRDGLYQKLRHIGLGGRTLNIIRSMYHVIQLKIPKEVIGFILERLSEISGAR